MALYSVPDVASVGIVYDTSSDLLPPGAWSSGRNVRFVDGTAKKFEGHSSIATPSVAPYGVVPVIKSTTPYWVYPGLKKVYSWDGTNHVNITRQTTGADVDYTGDASDIWNGGLVQGMLVLNNGKDPPASMVSVCTRVYYSSDVKNNTSATGIIFSCWPTLA